jgi:proteasome lid subunit RPN8/RPN11
MPKAAKITFGIDVVIPRIIEIGMLRSPHEACGLVVPDLSVPADSWVHELTNQSASPLDSYSIDGQTITKLLERLDVWEDVLVWHTHPRGQVGPSEHDMKSRIEGLRYLVVALPTGEASMF